MTEPTELERLRAMFEQAPAMLVVVQGPEHVYELANAAYRKFVGRSDLIGRRVVDAVPELEAQGFVRLLDQVYRTGEPFIGREVAIHAPADEGSAPSTRYIDFIYQPIRDEHGAVTGIFAEGHDVTQAKLARIALEQREAHFGAIFDQAAAGVAEVDLTGRFLRVNDRFCQIVGRERGELLQTRMQAITHPDDLPGNLRHFKHMLETGEPFQIEKRYLHPRGTTVWVNNSVTPVTGADGQTTVVAFTVDVTEQKQAEENNARLAAIVASTSDAIISFGAEDGRILTWNKGAERLFGYSEREALGGPVSLLVPPRHMLTDLENRTGVFDRAMADGHVLVETKRQRKDGSVVDVSVTATRMTDAAGRTLGVSAIFRDITEQKRWEEHQRLLVNELNHRVKNTLATVQSIVGQTLRNAGTVSEAREALESRVLSLSRAHDVLTRESWEGADIHQIVEQAVAPYSSDSEDRFHLSGEKLRVPPRMALALAMALQELATNAVKYGALSNATGEVRIAWRDGDGRLRLRWAEVGGPEVKPPTRRGFGTRLIERSLASELDGEVRIEFPPAGLVCVVDVPLQS